MVTYKELVIKKRTIHLISFIEVCQLIMFGQETISSFLYNVCMITTDSSSIPLD